MKWFYLPLILFLLLGFPFFQCDQLFVSNRLVCEDSFVIKSEYSDPIEEEFKFMSGGIDSKPLSSFLNQVKFFLQLKNPLSVLFSFFQGTSSFWRPAPRL
jgi:hypothetical protein